MISGRRQRSGDTGRRGNISEDFSSQDQAKPTAADKEAAEEAKKEE